MNIMSTNLSSGQILCHQYGNFCLRGADVRYGIFCEYCTGRSRKGGFEKVEKLGPRDRKRVGETVREAWEQEGFLLRPQHGLIIERWCSTKTK